MSEEKYEKIDMVGGVHLIDLPPGEYEVVDQSRVNSMTSRGWRIVSMFQESGLFSVDRNVRSEAGHYSTTIREIVPQVRTRFVMRHDEESVITTLSGELSSCKSRLSVLERENRELAKRKLEAESALETKVDQLSKEIRDRQSYERSFREAQHANRQLERDIGKLRAELGAARMREILER